MERKADIRKRLVVIFGSALLAASVAGCGGGGSSAPSTGGVTSNLEWTPPSTYVDNSPLDPTHAIDRYEVFVSTDNVLNDADEPMAHVSGTVTEGGVVRTVTFFDLRNLAPMLIHGEVYYVSVRAVGLDNQSSARSAPLEWQAEG